MPYAPGFQPPTPTRISDAVGSFPCNHGNLPRRNLISSADRIPVSERGGVSLNIEDLNSSVLYRADDQKSGRTKLITWGKLPVPKDDGDWLASNNEEGQTFEEFTKFVTLRSGRWKTHVNAACHTICLMPIIELEDECTLNSCLEYNEEDDLDDGFGTMSGGVDPNNMYSGGSTVDPTWPETGPPLDAVKEYTESFFGRPVRILPPAIVRRRDDSYTGSGKSKKKTSSMTWNVKGSTDSASVLARYGGSGGGASRVQVHVDPVLHQLAQLRYSGEAGDDCFSIIGVTMVDLYSHDSDLFVAGMAAGGDKVAVFSFHRYHPRMKMSPERWHDYGYAAKSGNYSYFPDGRKRPSVVPFPPTYTNSDAATRRELLRRSVKLLVHELAHVYGVDHCTFYACVMNGTGHLVEDFEAPHHLCPVDLRKLQYRLGFDIASRYRALGRLYKMWGWTKEARWTEKRLKGIEGQGLMIGEEGAGDDSSSALGRRKEVASAGGGDGKEGSGSSSTSATSSGGGSRARPKRRRLVKSPVS